MIALLIAGILSLAIGTLFFWLNLNSPIQTRIPAFTLPLGVAMILIWLGGLL